ncbi:MAG: response regulator [Nitrospira sp.]
MAKDIKQLKILLIDDDRFLLDMYSLKFKSAGIEIETSSTTDSAMVKLKGGSVYDVIILDIIMPGMDGLSLVKAIKTEKLSPTATIIMLTNQADDFEKAKGLGVDGYIIKASSIPSEVVNTVFGIYQDKNK